MAATTTPAKTTIKVAVTNNAAKDDTFSGATSAYDFLSENGSLTGKLDVLSNDPGAATLYSVQTIAPVTSTAQMAQELVGSVDSFSVVYEGKSYTGKLTLNADGTVGFDLSSLANAVDSSGARVLDHMAQGEVLTTTFWYTAKMANGTLSTSKVDVVITGSNDGPTIAATSVACGTVQEDGTLSVQGHIDGKDTDHGAVLTYSVNTATGTYGSLSLDSHSGAWTYNFDNAHHQDLAEGEVQYDTFTVTVTDDQGATASKVVTVKVVGTNDAPTIEATTTATGAVAEDGQLTAQGHIDGKDVDHGAVLTYSVNTTTSTYGSLSLDSHTGAWTYTLDNAHHQNLSEGETHNDTFIVTVTDENGATATKNVVVTITGTNDVPTVGAQVTASAAEDSATFGVDLLAGANDVDNGAVLHVANVEGLVAGVTLTGDSLSVDPADTSFQSLAVGEHVDITVTYDVVDEHGALVHQSAKITITGTNDVPTVGAQVTASGAEDSATFGVDLLAGANDVDNGAVLHVANVEGLVAGVTLTGDSLSVDPADASFQSLAVGEHVDITVTYDVVDEHGALVHQSAKITITGTNDVPTVGAQVTASGAEDSATFGVDLLAGANDVDNGAVLHVANVEGLVAGVTLTGDSLSVDPADASFQSLAVGEHADITVTYDVVDEHGALVHQSAKITITGTNDVPTVGAQVTASAAEDSAAFGVDLLAGANDVDNGAVLHVANVEGLVAGVTLTGDSLSVDPADASFQSLAVGEHVDITVTYDVVDEHGALVHQSAKITITGTNDVPVVSASQTINATEGSAAVTANAFANASDVDHGTTLSVTNGTLPAGVSYNAGTGLFTFDPTNAAYDHLAAGATQDVVVSYGVTDGIATTQTSVTFHVTGTNDTPTFAGTSTGSITEDASPNTVSGSVSISDPDDGQSSIVAQTNVAGTYGSLTIGTNGAWTYTLDNSKAVTNALNNSDHPTETFDIVSADGTHSSVVVTVNGHTEFSVSPVETAAGDPNDNDAKIGGINGTAGSDNFSGNGQTADTYYGGAGDDRINGNSGNDTLYGGSGNDTISGGADNDTIYGGSGNDVITGGNNNDFLYGGWGADTITGSQSADTFIYLDERDRGDTITDFTRTEGDKLDFAKIDANTNVAGDQAFTLYTDGQGHANGVWFVVETVGATSVTHVYADTNGDASTAEFWIDLTGSITLQGSDFFAL